MNRILAALSVIVLSVVACAEASSPNAPARQVQALAAPAGAPAPTSAATPMPSGDALQAAAEAQYTVEAKMTEAATATQGSERSTATQQRVSTLEALQDSQTAVAVSNALLEIEHVQATATENARANATGTAVVEAALTPAAAATATQAAQDDKWRDETRNWWFFFALISGGATVYVLLSSGGRWLDSRAVEAEKRGEAAVILAEAEAAATEAEAEARARHMMRRAYQVGQTFVIEDEYGVESHPISPVVLAPRGPEKAIVPVGEAGPASSPPSTEHLTADQNAMLRFVKDAIDAVEAGERSGHIPTDSAMGYGGGDWSMYVAALKRAGLVITRNGRPRSGEYGTMLSGRYRTLRVLRDAIERGLVDFPGLAGEKRSENIPNAPLERFSGDQAPDEERGRAAIAAD